MLGHRELTLEDYVEILRRRFWLLVASLAVCVTGGVGLTFAIPRRFISQTLVIVQQQRVPEDYVKPIITEDLNARLASMKEQILSRSRLEPIIERFSLFARDKNTMDERVELTRKAIKVSPISSGEGHMPGFYISFEGSSAQAAQEVCAEITMLFVSESLSAREQYAEGTTAFLSQQVAEAKRHLDEQDEKLATFQRKYIGRLPGQEQSNLNSLQALTAQLDASTQSLNRTQQDETFLEAVISQQTSDAPNQEASSVQSGVSLEDQLKLFLAQKRELEALYTPNHPDVAALSRKISEKQAEIAATSSSSGPDKAPAVPAHSDSPQLKQSKAQLRALQQSIANQKREQGRIAEEVRNYQSRIQSSPTVEAEFKQITRDHDTALQFYNALLSKMNESSMATNLERRQQGEQFQVLDSANLPDEPSFPNRRVFAGLGFAGGLFLGLFLTAILEYRDKALRDEKDVFTFTQLPTLACISRIDSLIRDSARETVPGLSSTPESANG